MGQNKRLTWSQRSRQTLYFNYIAFGEMLNDETIDANYWADIWDNHVNNGRVTIPCHHPAVYWGSKRHSGVLDDTVTREMFINPSLCLSNPASIDAAIDFVRNKEKFVSVNRRLLEQYRHTECVVCLKPFAPDDNIVYNCHVLHRECMSSLSKCPICRLQYIEYA